MMLAEVNDESPTGVEERDSGLRVFFASAIARGRAAVRLVAFDPSLNCEPVEVSDEDWAERSQSSLEPVRVGRLVIAPGHDLGGRFLEQPPKTTSEITIIIRPSMGFGTGHHASTRLCLRLLQDLSPSGASVLDVGTGSGVLAIAAAKLGALRVVAIDNDEDALRSARENVELNSVGDVVVLRPVDLADFVGRTPQAAFDLVLANLTGAALTRHAADLAATLRPDGTLVVSGFESEEHNSITQAFATLGLTPSGRGDEDGWAACSFRCEELRLR